MGTFQVMIGGVISIVFYSVVLGGLYKLFQISSDLGEIKDLLKDIRRNTELAPPPGLASRESSESLMRAVSAVSYEDLPSDVEQHHTAD